MQTFKDVKEHVKARRSTFRERKTLKVFLNYMALH